MSSRRLAADVAVGFWPWPGFTVQSAGIFPVRMLKQHYGFRAEPCAAGQGLAVRELVELPFRELVRLGLHGSLREMTCLPRRVASAPNENGPPSGRGRTAHLVEDGIWCVVLPKGLERNNLYVSSLTFSRPDGVVPLWQDSIGLQ
jgi:hypothetical protein